MEFAQNSAAGLRGLNYVVEAVQNDVDIALEELFFVKKLVSHKVAVDFHPREGTAAARRLCASGKDVRVLSFEMGFPQRIVVEDDGEKFLFGDGIEECESRVGAVDGERDSAVGLPVVRGTLRSVEHRCRFLVSSGEGEAVGIDELLPSGVGEGGLVADELLPAGLYERHEQLRYFRAAGGGESQERLERVTLLGGERLPYLPIQAEQGGIKAGLRLFALRGAQISAAHRKELFPRKFVEPFGNLRNVCFAVDFNPQLDHITSISLCQSRPRTGCGW